MRLSIASRRAAVLLIACAAAIMGCATPPPPSPPKRTTVTLLPDDDGHVGAVTVSTRSGGTQALDQAYSALVATQGTHAPAALAMRGREVIDAGYAQLMSAQPPRPASFILNFVLDGTALTPESEALLKRVIEAAQARKPTEITVFGHADESGTTERNLKLSAERAQAVADLLRKSDPALGSIEVQYFGDRNPLVPTANRKPEPRNRRVEIAIL